MIETTDEVVLMVIQRFANTKQEVEPDLERVIKQLISCALQIARLQGKDIRHIVALLNERSLVGVKTYGETLQEANLPKETLLQHLIEELLDACNYSEAILSSEK